MGETMKVLAIDTSNKTMSVALADESGIIDEITSNAHQNHSIQLMPAIEKITQDNGLKPTNITKIVVARGPGSYTGVRIGVTVAKTLAWTLGIDLVGISSLEAVALNAVDFEGYIAPIFDARRGQVFTSLFKSQEGTLKRVNEDQLRMASDWANELKELSYPILFVGVDVPIHETVISDILGTNALFEYGDKALPNAGKLALAGMYIEGVDVHHFVPNYARLAEAETNWLESQKDTPSNCAILQGDRR
ncbi:MAG: tsaB [Bacillales bacterium]|jgi:tRNA threonylcarbamoyladenosine biosynthesis protein TsaB|nr:tsaB [Bacillales bacterium]